MKLYDYQVTGKDGNTYGLRVLADADEAKGFTDAGIFADEICVIDGMQEVADSMVAELEWRLIQALGGAAQ